MLLNFFKRNFELSFIFLFLTGIVCWSYFFIHPISLPLPSGFAPLYEYTYRLLANSPILISIISLCLVLIEGITINLALIRQNILNSKSWIPAFIFVLFHFLLMHYSDGFTFLYCYLFIILAFAQLLGIYNNDAHYENVFWIGLFIGLASLIYFPSIIFLIFAYFSLINFSFYKIRKWLVLTLGAFIPYLYLFTFYFWNNSLFQFINIKQYLGGFSLPHFSSIQLTSIIPVAVFCILFAIGFIFANQKRQEKSIIFRRKTNLFLIYLFFCVALLFENKISGVFFTSIPFTGIFSLFLLENKRKAWAESILWIFIILVFVKIFVIK